MEQIATFVKGSCQAGSVCFVESVSVDSRRIGRSCLFVALKGDRVDGHDYIDDAVKNGAVAVLSQRPVPDCPVPVITVKSTQKALLDLAAGCRQLLPALRTVGVTGSVGKTTTKEMIAQVLGEKWKTVKTQGNFNNEIGLPLTMFRIDSTAQAAVLEMGMSSFGEIAQLTRIVRPQVAVITNIGVSHIEYLGSREGIRQAKLEIIEGLQPDGVLVLNGDEPLLWELRGKLPCQTVFYGMVNSGCDYRALDVRATATESDFTIEGGGKRYPVHLHAGGEHNVMNALAAAAVADAMDLPQQAVQDGLAHFENVGMRQNIYEKNGLTIVEDCYNASPDSVQAALRVLRDLPIEGRKIAVLGAMGELGEYTGPGHRQCGEMAARCADRLYVLGKDAGLYLEGARQAGMEEGALFHAGSHEQLAEYLRHHTAVGDGLLFKGSRFMKMERVLSLFFGEEV